MNNILFAFYNICKISRTQNILLYGITNYRLYNIISKLADKKNRTQIQAHHSFLNLLTAHPITFITFNQDKRQQSLRKFYLSAEITTLLEENKVKITSIKDLPPAAVINEEPEGVYP